MNRFLSLIDREILMDAGRVTAELAKQHAEAEFEKYRIIQDQLYISDFDKEKLLRFDKVEEAVEYARFLESDKKKFVLLENDLPDNY